MTDKIFNRCLAALAVVAIVLIWADDRGAHSAKGCITDTECAELHGED